MPSLPTALFRVALATLLASATGAQATITVHTSQASFLSAIAAAATDTFDAEFSDGPIFPYVGTAGPFGYSADADFDGMFFVANGADVYLSTNTPQESITFYDFTGGVQAVGGLFFATDFNGVVVPGVSVSFSATDVDGSVTHTLASSHAGSFIGFVSDGPLFTLQALAAPAGLANTFTTVNNLTLGVAAPVPEPGQWALMLGGLALIGGALRRRA
ncbi:PEPxxWA-CTERM sorting domain-containing protein [Ideonella sp. A 288]|uniref:PEPxxWA-CTERM sorting domain-containing protein n=1 Tax=Ideonella sp. A 288 TaxID=1962181 RepID=UPI000B4ADD47|nr:PEPxxWA-CTERM sorting domain-containing protein [Ideonella sp. A 288]